MCWKKVSFGVLAHVGLALAPQRQTWRWTQSLTAGKRSVKEEAAWAEGNSLRNLGNSLRNVTSGRGRFLGDWNSGTLNLWVWSDGTRAAREPQEWLIVQKRSMGMLCKSVSSIRLRSGTGRSCLRPQTKRPNLRKESYRIAVGGSGNT